MLRAVSASTSPSRLNSRASEALRHSPAPTIRAFLYFGVSIGCSLFCPEGGMCDSPPQQMSSEGEKSMQQRPQNRIANSDRQPGQELQMGSTSLLAPDTSGMNFYRADPALADLLRIHLPDSLFRHIEPHLDRLGAPARGYLA